VNTISQYHWVLRGLQASWLLLAVFGGCRKESGANEEHLAHLLPAHWPENLADACLKLDHRLTALQVDEQAQPERKELVEIISWLPEIAADTELNEAQWQPLYDQSESLRTKLLAGAAIADLSPQFEQLQELIHALSPVANP